MSQKDYQTNSVRRQSHSGQHAARLILSLVLAGMAGQSFAQVAPSDQNQSAPLTITLQDALQRARENEPQYRSALADLGLAREDRVQARAGLLPGVNFNNSFVYTQGTGPLPASCQTSTAGCPTTRFIANNGVHEYISQGNVHEALSLTNVAD